MVIQYSITITITNSNNDNGIWCLVTVLAMQRQGMVRCLITIWAFTLLFSLGGDVAIVLW